MSTSIRSHVVTAVIAAATALIVTGAPAMARSAESFVRAGDADTVNGFGAVGCGATIENRSGKLVATCATTGRLPNNIIAKAPDSNLLDGMNSSAFLGAGAKAADSELLDGMDSTEFLGAGAKAADSDRLDGIDSDGFVLDGETVAEATHAASASTASNAGLLDGIDSTGFMRRGIYRTTMQGTGTCPNPDACFLRVDCQSGDTLLSGGFDSLDNGTRLIATRPGKDLSLGQPTAFGWVVWWDNNSTMDTVEVTIVCANN